MSVQGNCPRRWVSVFQAYELVKQPGFPVLRIGTRILIPVDSSMPGSTVKLKAVKRMETNELSCITSTAHFVTDICP